MHTIDIRNDDGITIGEPATDRTIFTVISLVCMMVLAWLLGFRYEKLRDSMVRRNAMSILIVTLYVLVFIYIICAASLVAGQGLHNYKLCVAGTFSCLVFYVLIKFSLFIFIVERIHVVRAPFYRRREDPLYISCLVMIVVFYAAISINSFTHTITTMRERCRFGISGTTSIPVITVNIFTDLVLTAVFFYLLRPVVTARSAARINVDSSDSNSTMPRNESNVQKNIRTVLWKSIIGSLLIEIPMAANMVQFMVTGGEEPGMICLSICLVDVFWDALVIQWLIFSAVDEQNSLAREKKRKRKALLSRVRSLHTLESGQYGTRTGSGTGSGNGTDNFSLGGDEVALPPPSRYNAGL